ncbi:MAG: hypothetical protein GY789_09165 [Hyphomicrobiales bacterium]|nr:hypothetical protein [Hyphomicrobiales bacterium]MCP4997217.1 hypothetical protein [Hyphomicrobiales bacterium]
MTPLERYVEPAKARDGFWRVIVGAMLIALIWVVGTIVVLLCAAILSVAANPGRSIVSALDAFVLSDTPLTVMILLASICTIWIGLWIVGRYQHRQPFGTFFSPDRRFHSIPFLKGLVFGAVFYTVLTVLEFGLAQDLQDGLKFGQWAPFLSRW